MGLIALLIFVIIVFFGLIALQILLAKQDNVWIGLILPIITFGFSLIIVLGIVLDNYYGLPVIPIALALFTPTIIMLVIFVSGRGKRTKQRSLEKMSAQDLE